MLVQAPSEQGVHSIQSNGSTVETKDDVDDWQKHFSKQFQHLFRRVGRIRNYKVQAEFFINLVPIQQKGRRVPITLQKNLIKRSKNFWNNGIFKSWKNVRIKFCFTYCHHGEKNGSVKLALESRELNKHVHKNKYQMPNFEELMDIIVGQTISERKQGDVFFHRWTSRTHMDNYH